MAIAAASLHAQISNIQLTASGLTCSMCSKSIYKALLQIPYVDSVGTDIDNSAFNIVVKKGADVDVDDIKKAVENAGFFVASLSIVIKTDEPTVDKDKHIELGGRTYHFVGIKETKLPTVATLKVIDKGFVTKKEWTKYSHKTAMSCFATGEMAACCPTHSSTSNRIYHVTL